MDSEQATPSLSQAQRLKKYSQEGHLTLDMMRVIMGEEKKSDLEGLSPYREISPRFDMAALPQQGAAPLAPLRGYPCTPTKTVHPPLASVPFLRVLLSYPGGDTHSHLPLERRHCEPRKRQISRCRSRLPKRRKADKRMGRNDP